MSTAAAAAPVMLPLLRRVCSCYSPSAKHVLLHDRYLQNQLLSDKIILSKQTLQKFWKHDQAYGHVCGSFSVLALADAVSFL